ncbi:MAG: response regulator transcription factor [Bacillota bacterium]|nr:response regulator transcription factor [Bacillota bacterium]
MAKILIAEDNISLRQLMQIHLKRAGHTVYEAGNGEEALDVMDHNHVDIIIADIMMPGMDGYELIKTIRNVNIDLPILIVTAKDSLEDKKVGFNIGADDYMTKPIEMEEMLLRVDAMLRRCRIADSQRLTVGNVKLDMATLTVTTGDTEIILRNKEFLLLEKLLSSPKKIFTRQALMDEIWGYDTTSTLRTVDAHIKLLRAKLKDIDDFTIETIRGLGYKAVIHK